jgi:16S rRNA U516 pseudouridylate synthase RsuA-like enzyme
VYPARRLDTGGEGLLVLTGEGALQAHVTEPRRMDEPPGLWRRDPPIRARLHIPTAWLELKLAQGKNRQVRRMTRQNRALDVVSYTPGRRSVDPGWPRP